MLCEDIGGEVSRQTGSEAETLSRLERDKLVPL